MTSEDQRMSRRGPAVLLALFLSVLLGVPAPAASLGGAAPAGVKQLQSGKSALATRLPRRASEDQVDPQDAPPLWLDGAPRVETEFLSLRPAAGPPVSTDTVRAGARHIPYRARAPPAA